MSPIVPAVMLTATLYGPWFSIAIPPLQFAALIGEAILAIAAHRTLAQAIAGGGFAIALAGLAATVLRDRWIEHRASKVFDWEGFEQALASYSGAPPSNVDRNDSV